MKLQNVTKGQIVLYFGSNNIVLQPNSISSELMLSKGIVDNVSKYNLTSVSIKLILTNLQENDFIADNYQVETLSHFLVTSEGDVQQAAETELTQDNSVNGGEVDSENDVTEDEEPEPSEDEEPEPSEDDEE